MSVVAKTFRAIKDTAEKIRNDEHQIVGTMSVGDAWAQGDILIVSLEHLPEHVIPIANPNVQLAPGNSQGSRHCLSSLDGVTMYRIASPNPLDGPILQSDHPIRVNHPEHGDVTVPAGTYAIIYQRAFERDRFATSTRGLQRVRD